MSKKFFIALSLIVCGLLFASEIEFTKLDTLYILQTTDIHGNIFAYDYFLDEPAQRGLAKIHTRIKEYRRKYETVLVDCGDMIQGTPLTYYYNRIDTVSAHPMIEAMNIMEYDAFTVGNHEIEQGTDVYNRCRNQSDFPWLSANSTLENDSTYFQPYIIIERNNLKIGILGLTTPAIPMWLDDSLYPGIKWQDMIETASKYVKILRPQVDILIGTFHSGFDETDGAEKTKLMDLPTDNASGLVAIQVPGFDLIFGGHSHNELPMKKSISVDENSPLQLISGSWGRKLGVAEIITASNADSSWIIQKSVWLEDIKEIQTSEEFIDLQSIYHQAVLDYIRKEIGTSKDTLSSAKSRLQDSALMQLINQAQLDFTDADISFAACFNTNVNIEPGPIKVKDIYKLYPYENYLYVVSMTGQQIKDFLEYSSRYYYWENGKLQTNQNIKGYNFDMAEGISYSIDYTKKSGDRIGNILLSDSASRLDLNKKYKVAMNSYRASGGGGHLPAAGAQENEVLFKSNLEMRNILAEYIMKIGFIENIVDSNWKIIIPQ
ncbi:MAG: bifunctional metallophosphatase/5'-nucleotidase [Candidatus Cloacimonadota bacterium]|nr:MAG: bifunctional metallophosphatase/5'-nucleotidase [Candidatus Cloacimonadota bacterium]